MSDSKRNHATIPTQEQINAEVENPGDMCDGCKAENRAQWSLATK